MELKFSLYHHLPSMDEVKNDIILHNSSKKAEKIDKANKLPNIKQAKKLSQEVPHFIGHRARLKEKCYKFAANLSDYEILEIMLFWAIPRRDTKVLAKTLLNTFGSLSEILYAEEDKLLAIPQITKNIKLNFTIIREFLERVLKGKFINKHVLSSWSVLIEYLQTTMGDIKTEQFRAIFLNKKNMIIADEIQACGTVDQTPVYPREIVKRALFHEASAIILVHNHPSGNPKPSKADIAITQEVQKACATLNILLHDHVIVCKKKFLSFKSEYLL
jgi:DNA repair protein RadC